MIILRQKHSDYTTGDVFIGAKKVACSLELPWRDNKKDVSCIPDGKYKYKIDTYHSKNPEIKPYKAIKIMNVPGRTGIWCHVGNRIENTTGCILLGLEKTKDKSQVLYSRSALKKILGSIADEGEIRFATAGINIKDTVRDTLEKAKERAQKKLDVITLNPPKVKWYEKAWALFSGKKRAISLVALGAGTLIGGGIGTLLRGVGLFVAPVALVDMSLKNQTKYGEKGKFEKKDFWALVINILEQFIKSLKGMVK